MKEGDWARNGLVIAAPSSGAGKTTVTLGVLRAFARRGVVERKAHIVMVSSTFRACVLAVACMHRGRK